MTGESGNPRARKGSRFAGLKEKKSPAMLRGGERKKNVIRGRGVPNDGRSGGWVRARTPKRFPYGTLEEELHKRVNWWALGECTGEGGGGKGENYHPSQELTAKMEGVSEAGVIGGQLQMGVGEVDNQAQPLLGEEQRWGYTWRQPPLSQLADQKSREING